MELVGWPGTPAIPPSGRKSGRRVVSAGHDIAGAQRLECLVMDVDRLRAIPLFAGLDADALFWVGVFATESSVPAGKEIVREGDFGYEVMAIEDGHADVVRGGRRLATLGPGDYFGEIAVLERTLRTATVVATTPMRLVTLSHWQLRRAGGVVDAMRARIDERRRSFT